MKNFNDCSQCFFATPSEKDRIWCTRLCLDIFCPENECSNNCDHFIIIDFVEHHAKEIEEFINSLAEIKKILEEE